MSDLTLFDFQGVSVESFVDDRGTVWFRATRVCEILGFSNPVKALKLHAEDCYKEFSIGPGRPANYLNEPGFYAMVFASKSPKAKAFQQTVFEDILPNIRKNGYYIDPNATKAQLESLQRDILHHANWTVTEFLETLEEDQADRRLSWEDF
ncbi:MAG: BRO-N domain-containing protein [Plesiomonas shigelloides]